VAAADSYTFQRPAINPNKWFEAMTGRRPRHSGTGAADIDLRQIVKRMLANSLPLLWPD
jgi:hypothetical protein